MSDWIDNLERKAKAATPGPWVADHSEEDNSAVKQEGRAWWDGLAFCRRPADAKFIAAADPDTFLRLIKQAQNYNAEADRHASRVVAMEAENEDLTAERDVLAARLAEIAAERDQWREMYQAQVHLAHVSDMKVAAVEALADETEQAGDPLLRLDRLRAALSAALTDTKENDR